MKYIFILYFLTNVLLTTAQNTVDTLLQSNTINRVLPTQSNKVLKINDTLKNKDSIIIPSTQSDSSAYKILYQYPLLNLQNKEYLINNTRDVNNNEGQFYIIALCLLLLAITKTLFKKNFNNVFAIFFQPNFRQKQTKEQLLQDNVATIMLNAVFVCTLSVFLSIVLPQFTKITINNYTLLAGCLVLLTIVYVVKYLFLNFIGWAFNISDATNAYLFIISIFNKIIGIVLAPAIVIAAFCNSSIVNSVLTILFIVLAILMAYRVVIGYKSASTRLKINLIHFFLYFCSVEILPLLILYKCVLKYL